MTAHYTPSAAQLRQELHAVATSTSLDLVADQIDDIEDPAQRQELMRLYHQRRDELAAQSTARKPDAMTEHYDDTTTAPELAAATVAGDLLAALIDELRLLDRPWQSLPEVDQEDVIDRLRARVQANVGAAVRIIAADARPVIAAEVESVTVKDGIKAVLKLSKGDVNRHHLVDAQGDVVLIVVAGAAQYTGGLDAVQAEPDQRALGLGKEYGEEAA